MRYYYSVRETALCRINKSLSCTFIEGGGKPTCDFSQYILRQLLCPEVFFSQRLLCPDLFKLLLHAELSNLFCSTSLLCAEMLELFLLLKFGVSEKFESSLCSLHALMCPEMRRHVVTVRSQNVERRLLRVKELCIWPATP